MKISNKLLLGTTLFGLITHFFYALTLASYSNITSIFLVSGTCLLTGALVGFLFGIPKRTSQADNHSSEGGLTYIPNTNLEQISDWLTKILLGVGLVELNTIASYISSTSKLIAGQIGGGAVSELYITSTVIFFLICGFFLSYLWTRLELARAFQKSDNQLQQLITQAASALDEVDESSLTPAQLELLKGTSKAIENQISSKYRTSNELEHRLRYLANEYVNLRKSIPSGYKRTQKLSAIYSEMRLLANKLDGNIAWLPTPSNSTDEGMRLLSIAFINSKPGIDKSNYLLEIVNTSYSAFEQYQALRAIKNSIPFLNDEKRMFLAQELTAKMNDTSSHISNSGDRRQLVDDILNLIQMD